LDGIWNAQWHIEDDVLYDKIEIKQLNNKVIARYAQIPNYLNCDGKPILAGSVYFEGMIFSDSIIGESWVCTNTQKNIIPLHLKIQESGNRLFGTWMNSNGEENKFIFRKVSNSSSSVIEIKYSKESNSNVNTIEFRIKEVDIKEIDCDVIVLKHAQEFYQADYAVARALEVLDLSVPPEDHRYFSTKGKISAKNVLFVGVPPLKYFNYEQIRRFPSKFLELLSDIAPNTIHIATTFHIASLDETEAAFSLFAGILDGLGRNFPKALKKITIVERNPRLIRRLKDAFDANLAGEKHVSKLDKEWGYLLTIPLKKESAEGKVVSLEPQNTIEKTGKRSDTKPVVFVAMPFRKDMEDVFYFGIQDPSRDIGFLCERIDNESFTGDILEQVKSKIDNCTVVIADLTGSNPNVYLEVGYAWGKGKPTILLVKDGEELKFDVRGYKHLKYETIKGLKESLTKELFGLKDRKLI
jgi:hypothetical protein